MDKMTFFYTLICLISAYGAVVVFLYLRFYLCRNSKQTGLLAGLNGEERRDILAEAHLKRGLFFHDRSMFTRAMVDYEAAMEFAVDPSQAELYIRYAVAQKPVPNFVVEQGGKSASSTELSVPEIVKPEPSIPSCDGEGGDEDGHGADGADGSEMDATSEPDAQGHFEQGEVFAQGGFHEEAVEEFSLALGLTQNEPKIYKARAASLEKIGDLQGALEDYQTLLNFGYQGALVNHKKGEILMKLERPTEASEAYGASLKIDPKQPEVLYDRGVSLLELEMFSEAANDFSRAITLDPGFAMAYLKRGHSKIQLNLYVDAVKDFTKAIELMPDNYETFLRRGLANSQRAMREAAIEDFTRVIELEEKNDTAFYHRA